MTRYDFTAAALVLNALKAGYLIADDLALEAVLLDASKQALSFISCKRCAAQATELPCVVAADQIMPFWHSISQPHSHHQLLVLDQHFATSKLVITEVVNVIGLSKTLQTAEKKEVTLLMEQAVRHIRRAGRFASAGAFLEELDSLPVASKKDTLLSRVNQMCKNTCKKFGVPVAELES